jgi:hypothetical protein
MKKTARNRNWVLSRPLVYSWSANLTPFVAYGNNSRGAQNETPWLRRGQHTVHTR